MPKRTIIAAILALQFGAIHGAGAQERVYHFKDTPFKRVAYDKNFFAEVFLNRNIANIEKFRKDRNIITGLFHESNVAAFDLVDLDKLDTVGRTVIIVFNASNEDKLPAFLSRFKGIQPFAKYFDNQSHCGGATYTQVGENGEKFLIVREEGNGKDLAYILNFLANVQKIASYKNRANCFKPSD
jgi:hypothetical protein